MGEILEHHRPARILLVSGPRSYRQSGAAERLEPQLHEYDLVRFARSAELPSLEDVLAARALLESSAAELIVAVGGGGALDLAKAARTPFVVAGDDRQRRLRLEQTQPVDVPLVAVPTTAGTGAETTQFAVVYIDGIKHSLDDARVLPDYAIVDPSLSESLGPRATAVTGMDALAQGIESIWSASSSAHSRRYAACAVRLVLDNLECAVTSPGRRSREAMALAAHLAGRAINETRTTACHAVSYPITAHFAVPHGHAVALTLPQMLVFNAAVEPADVNDPAGVDGVRRKIELVLELLDVETAEAGAERLRELMRGISLETTLGELGIRDVEVIVAEGFNPERAGNNPRRLTAEALRAMLA